MSKSSERVSESVAFASDDHGWLRPKRIPATQYTGQFLKDLRARNEVLAVDEGWTGVKERLPAGIGWVLYPNGDLQRIGVA